MGLKNKLVLFIPLFYFLIDCISGFSVSALFGEPHLVQTLFLTFWMVLWWIFEIMPLGITASIPLFYLPLTQVSNIKEVAPFYANPVIYLFLGGFIIARALEKTKLNERIALFILGITGKSDRGIVLGFVIATAGLSMWISNTATTVMMVPIALSVLYFLENNVDKKFSSDLKSFSVVLFLSIAYSANIGGIATPIGTPPNVVFMGYLNELYNRNVDFYKWMMATLPIVIVLLIAMTYLLRTVYKYEFDLPKDFKKFIQKRFKDLGKMGSSQKITITIFLMAAFLWAFKGLMGQYIPMFSKLHDASIAMFCGILLFFIPSPEEKFKPILNEKDIGKLPWNIVLLFGGGMALAGALKKMGLIEDFTNTLASMNLSSSYLLIFLLAAMALFMTEIMSNVALCVVALPIIMKLGESQGLDPLMVALPAALCTSFAFSMPISTPPNAIVFGTERIQMHQMLKAGLLLNILALIVTMTLGYALIPMVLR